MRARRATPYGAVKRVIDVLVAGTALVLSSPLLAGVALAVRWKLGSPVLFRQQRPGRHGEPFMLLKFRSMKILGPSDSPANDADRITPFGLRLRSTSLDELPSLWNVLRGDMSLIGPRPLLMEYLDRYTPEQARRHEVRPGITGLAQVRGRNLLSWEEKFAADVEYVDKVDLATDVRILFVTCAKVLRRTGISAPGEINMSTFMGTAAPAEAVVPRQDGASSDLPDLPDLADVTVADAPSLAQHR